MSAETSSRVLVSENERIKRKKRGLTGASGLTLSVTRVGKPFRKRVCARTSVKSEIFVAGIMEYLLKEVLLKADELATQHDEKQTEKKTKGKKRITPALLSQALLSDEELGALFRSGLMTHTGRVIGSAPNTHHLIKVKKSDEA
jgi:hypothetical protein